MRLLCLLVITAIFLTACSPSGNEPAPQAKEPESETPSIVADTVYTNGRIYTVNEAQPWAEAVAIKDGKFVAVGSTDDVAAVTGDSTDVIDLGGDFAMPGLIDIHTHPSMSMNFRVFCELPGSFYLPTDEMTVEALKKCADEYPEDQEWFFAEGYASPVMKTETLTKEFLDELFADRPAYVKDESGHFGFANTKAFELAGVDENTPDTPQAFFSRTNDGKPAGQIFEGGMNPFEELILPLASEIAQTAKLRLLDDATQSGITATGDAYVFEHDLSDWQKFKSEGRLNLHVRLYIQGNFGTGVINTPASEVLRFYEEYDLPGEPGVKMSMGGALESRTEPMLNDAYILDGSDINPLIAADEFATYMKELDAAGIQAKVHAIGDGTVRATIDGFLAAINERGNNELRHHIDHCNYIQPEDMARVVDNDIPCSAWPMLGAPIDFITAQAEIIKPEAYKRGMPLRAMLDAKIMAANHSDAPQANLWPWWGMEATITRGFPGHPEIEKFNEDQAITLEETIRVHTINGAYVLNMDDLTGSIKVGMSADMIVLGHNLFEIPVTDIHKTEVQRTIFKGDVVYSALQ
jgi:predicted amidohydrolase YtcJ